MSKWGKIEDACNATSAEENATIVMPPSTFHFRRAAMNTTKMLEDINSVTVKLQQQALPLHKCWDLQELLIDTVQKGRAYQLSPWFNNNFGTMYINPKSDKRPNKAFVNATIKMQKRAAHTLLTSEASAIRQWLKKVPANDNRMSLADRLKNPEPRGEKRTAEQLHGQDNHDGDNCLDNVIGSAAEVERLWSEARYIMTSSRSRMAPIFFEAILFLCYNHYLWDEKTVQEALLTVKGDQKMDRLEKKMQELDAEEQSEDDKEDEDEEESD